MGMERVMIGRLMRSATTGFVFGWRKHFELMEKALAFFKDQGNPSVRISAQCYLEKFYMRFGFEPIGEPYPEDNIPHIEMLRK